MALTIHQRRRRDTIIAVAAMCVILFALLGKTVVQAIIIPDMPGYAKQAPAGSFAPLPWDQLQQGKMQYGFSPEIPKSISALNGKPVLLRGFMLPLHKSGESSEFFIAAKQRGCAFCNPPGPADVVKIKIAGGKQMTPTDWPVKVYGKFRAATGAGKDEALYLIDDATLVITH